jgi:hypothetical protein
MLDSLKIKTQKGEFPMSENRLKPDPELDDPKPLDKWKMARDFGILGSLVTILWLSVKYLAVWNDVSYRLEIGLVGGFVILAFLLWIVLSLYLNTDGDSERKEFIDLNARILGSAALVISLLFTWQGLKNNQKTSEENQMLTLQSLEKAERQQTEDRYNQILGRYNRALEQLGNAEKAGRLGAIYSLGKIAEDSIEFSEKNPGSKDLYWEIIQTLAAFVRGNAPVSKTSARPVTEMPSDIQAALDVLARRVRSYQNGEAPRLQLFRTDLRGAELKDIEPTPNDPQRKGANFDGASLYDVSFERANLRGIKLRGAQLNRAIFRNALLSNADLTDADLDGADLEGADLGQAIVDAETIMTAKNWKKAKTLPQSVCTEIIKLNESSTGC